MIAGHRVLYRDRRFYAAFPAVTRLADGSLLVAFRRARDPRCLLSGRDERVDHLDPRSHLLTLRLDAALETIGAVRPVSLDPQAADQDASLLTLANGDILLASFAYYPCPPQIGRQAKATPEAAHSGGSLFLFWGGNVRLSRDGGQNWSAPRYLPALPDQPDIVPGRRAHLGGAPRGRLVETPAGEILMATYSGPVSHLLASDDGGRRWTVRGEIARDPAGKIAFEEPALYRSPAGRLIAFHRTAHAGDRLATATSRDDGGHWSAWRLHDVIGHPFDVLTLADGRLLLTYGYRHPPYGLRARLLDAEAETLEEAPEIIIRDDGPSADLGYPWACQMADGRVVVVYYFSAPDGVRQIEASLIDLT